MHIEALFTPAQQALVAGLHKRSRSVGPASTLLLDWPTAAAVTGLGAKLKRV